MTLPAWFPTRFILYALVGASGTLAHYLLFVALLALDAAVLLASLAGYVLGALVNYALNYAVTFASQRPHCEAAPRFFGVAALGLALNLLIVAILHQWAGWHPLAAQVAATLVCLFATFVLNARWSFDEGAGRPKT
ncbi:GtrA family protein [Aureimonas sp. SK2]|uniref:GtrA family protein n=1 Tax=Aureimonas sp. SK2 TaxID=3015992 RepID=UPI0024441D04|nr:GtrA family protein [Aureimonas sp. SK2]